MQLIDTTKLSSQLCEKPIQAKLSYASKKNFVGRVIAGYHENIDNIALMTPKSAQALCNVQNYLIKHHQLGLLVHDAYRPHKAVRDFMAWSLQTVANPYELERKEKHYPNIEKSELFALGYLAEDSYHCYGNTVDLVLINLVTQEVLDMGARFDFMDELAHLTTDESIIGKNAYKNRMILQNAMMQFDFEPYEKEFWHFSHRGILGREINTAMDTDVVDNN